MTGAAAELHDSDSTAVAGQDDAGVMQLKSSLISHTQRPSQHGRAETPQPGLRPIHRGLTGPSR